MKRKAIDESENYYNKEARLSEDLDIVDETSKDRKSEKEERKKEISEEAMLREMVDEPLYDIEADDQFIFPQEDLTEENEKLPKEGVCQGLVIDYIVHNINSDDDSPSYLESLSSDDRKLSDAYVQKIIEYQNILQTAFFPDSLLAEFELEDLRLAESERMESLLNSLAGCLIIRGKSYMGISLRSSEGYHILLISLMENDDYNEYTIYDPSTGEYFFISAESIADIKQALKVIFDHYRDDRNFEEIYLFDLGMMVEESKMLEDGQELVKQFEMLQGIIKGNADAGASSFEIIDILSHDADNFRNYIEIIKYEIIALAAKTGIEELLQTLQAIPEEFLDDFIDRINIAINMLHSTVDHEDWTSLQQNIESISNKSLLDLLKSAIEECDYAGDDVDQDDHSSDDSTDHSHSTEERAEDITTDQDASGSKHSDSVNQEESDDKKDTIHSDFPEHSVENTNALLEFLLQRLFSWFEGMSEHLQEKILNSTPVKSLINDLSIRVGLIMHEVKFELSYYDKDLHNGASDETQNNIDDTIKILNEASEDLVDTKLVYNYSVVSKMIFVSSGSTSFIGVSTSYHMDQHLENLHAVSA